MPIYGSTLICVSGTYSLSEYTAEATIVWSIFPSTAATISDSGSSVTLTHNRSYNGSLTLTATVETACGSVKVEKDVWVGNPNDVTKLTHVSFGCTVGEIFVKSVASAEQYEWQVYGANIVAPASGTTYIGEESSIFVDPNDGNNDFTVQIRAINACGYSNWYSKTIPINCDGGPTPLSTTPVERQKFNITIFPNPASEILRIDTGSAGRTSQVNVNKAVPQYKFYDFNGNLILQGSLLDNTDIDVSKLDNGRYVLKIQMENNKEETHHILIN